MRWHSLLNPFFVKHTHILVENLRQHFRLVLISYEWSSTNIIQEKKYETLKCSFPNRIYPTESYTLYPHTHTIQVALVTSIINRMNFKFSSLDKIVWWFSDENEISASFAIQFDSGGDAVVCCFFSDLLDRRRKLQWKSIYTLYLYRYRVNNICSG